MSQFAALLLLAFFLKLFAVGLGSRLLLRRYPDLLGSLLGAWLLSQCFFILWMLILSSFHGLTSLSIWAGLVFLNLSLLVLVVREKEPPRLSLSDCKLVFSSPGLIALLGAAGVFIALTYRSLYYFDNTWDAITYGLTRIEFYAHYQSLFIVQPTRAFNIFSNEWNGELNALFYLLATARDQATSFANVEIWLVSFVGYSWLSGLFKLPVRLRLAAGLLLSTAPVLLGLTMTVKGDLLAIISFAIALGFTLRALGIEKAQANPLDFLFAITSLGLANGAKIIVLPYVGPVVILLILVSFFSQEKRIKVSLILSGFALLAITNSRYILNYFSYGDFFKHIESTTPALGNVVNNLSGIATISLSFPSSIFQQKPDAAVMAYGFGFIFFPLIFWACLGLGFKLNNYSRQEKGKIKLAPRFLWLSLFLCFGFCFLLYTLLWYPWSFRYFCPYLMIVLVLALAWPCWNLKLIHNRLRFQKVLTYFFMVIVILNSLYVFLSAGETFPVEYPVAMKQTEMERKVALHPYLWTGVNGLRSIDFGKMKQANLLLFNEVNAAVLPFFGKNHQNKIELVDSLTVFNEKAARNHYDFLVLSMPPSSRPIELHLSGYELRSSTDFWAIYAPIKPST